MRKKAAAGSPHRRKNKNRVIARFFCFCAFWCAAFGAIRLQAQQAPRPYGQVPTTRQLHWQETEMYCLVHFGMATFTDKEWAYGDEDPKLFNPVNFDATQIVAAAKAGGFKGIVVVAKHHDGFCLWPTSTTDHRSGWHNGNGDMLREYQIACQKLGMKMGVYCSPWDRNNAAYGQPAYVTDVYYRQLAELYTRYRELFLSWHDGANGGDGFYGGAREKRTIDRSTYYNWDTLWGITRRLQPGAAIFGDVGPDVRWVGNEAGRAGETSWATYTPHAPDPAKRPANGYVLDREGVEGTRNGEYWMPAECDVPLRPGWFYHASDDGKTKSVNKLVDLYYASVGRGACLDLGISPDKTGRIPQADVDTLAKFGKRLRNTFEKNLADGARLAADDIRSRNGKFLPSNVIDKDRYSYWATSDGGRTPTLTVRLRGTKTFDVIRLRENVKLGQRIEAAAVDAWDDGKWKEIATVTSIGANRLVRLEKPVTTDRVRLRITKSPVCIALSDFALFKQAN